MARYRDDDDDRDYDRRRRRDDRDDERDDRPRRRRSREDDDDPPAKKGGTGTVLLIVGLAVGIPLLACVGLGGWFFFWVKGKAEEAQGGVHARDTAQEFMDTLERNQADTAYKNLTTDTFKASTSLEQFKKLVAANPALTRPNYSYPNEYYKDPTGTMPNRRLTLTYTVSPNSYFDDTPAPGWPEPGGPPPATKPQIKEVTCTVTVVEQPDKTWKVDGFTVP